jgi:hypothetical protein
MTTDDMSRVDKTIIWCAKVIDDLKAGGLVEGAPALSPKGLALYDQIKAEGFEPTPEEFDWTMQYLAGLKR